MPIELIWLLLLVALIIFLITVPKRPVYESTFIAFVVIYIVSNIVSMKWEKIGEIITSSFSQTVLYTIFAFMAFTIVMKETRIMDSCVAIITSIFGRFKGGTAYADVIANVFLGALSGGGPQNVLLIGSVTLPAMQKSRIPNRLSINVSAFDSLMGNFIPPSPTYAAAFGIYVAYCSAAGMTGLSSAHLWGAMWIISAIMIVFRMATIFVSCRMNRVSVVPREELPRFRDAVKSGWKALFLPVIIAFPFVLDMVFEPFIVERIGETAASQLTNGILLFLPGLTAILAFLFGIRRPKMTDLARSFAEGANGIVMIVAMVLMSVMIGNLISVDEIGRFLGELQLPFVLIALIIPLLTTLLSMIISSVAVTIFFGNMMLSVMVAVGADPLIVTAMLPLICGGLSGTIPPSSPCLFVGANILKCGMHGVNSIAVRWTLEQLLFIEALFIIACLL